MVALVEKRWFAAAARVLPPLLVKEDMGLTVAAYGLDMIVQRRHRLGTALSRRVSGPSLAVRLLPPNSLYWATHGTHYNAVLMPVIFVALIAAASDMISSPRVPVRLYGTAAPWASLLIAVVLLPSFAFGALLQPSFYRTPAHVIAAKRVLALIPDGASVASSSGLAPHLVDRADVVVFPSASTRPVRWVVVDMKQRANVPRSIAVQDAALGRLATLGYARVAEDDGVMLFRR